MTAYKFSLDRALGGLAKIVPTRTLVIGFLVTATCYLTGCNPGYRGPVKTLAFSPDRTRLVSVCTDGIARVHDTNTHAEDFSFVVDERKEAKWYLIGPNLSTIVTGREDGSIRILDAQKGGELLRECAGSDGPINALAIGRDYIAAGSCNGTVFIWDIEAGTKPRELPTSQGKKITALAFSKDGKHLASSGEDLVICIWDTKGHSEKPITTVNQVGLVSAMAFSLDGDSLVTVTQDCTVCLWNVREGAKKSSFVTKKEVRFVDLSPDGKFCATVSGSMDDIEGVARIHDFQNPEKKELVLGDRKDVAVLAFSKDGTTLSAGHRDGTVFYWDLTPTGAQAQQPRTTSCMAQLMNRIGDTSLLNNIGFLAGAIVGGIFTLLTTTRRSVKGSSEAWIAFRKFTVFMPRSFRLRRYWVSEIQVRWVKMIKVWYCPVIIFGNSYRLRFLGFVCGIIAFCVVAGVLAVAFGAVLGWFAGYFGAVVGLVVGFAIALATLKDRINPIQFLGRPYSKMLYSDFTSKDEQIRTISPGPFLVLCVFQNTAAFAIAGTFLCSQFLPQESTPLLNGIALLLFAFVLARVVNMIVRWGLDFVSGSEGKGTSEPADVQQNRARFRDAVAFSFTAIPTFVVNFCLVKPALAQLTESELLGAILKNLAHACGKDGTLDVAVAFVLFAFVTIVNYWLGNHAAPESTN